MVRFLRLALALPACGGLLHDARPGPHRQQQHAPATPVDWLPGERGVSAFFKEGGEFAVAPAERLTGRSSGARATTPEPQPGSGSSSSLSFFAPDFGSDDDEYDDLLPPKAPESYREGELGEGRYGDAGGGRTEGFYAALQEEPDRLRASDLNEVLLPDHLDRLKFTNFPLQAYGACFKWDTLVEDALDVYRQPWQAVAEQHGLRMPDDDEVQRAVSMRPERAIQQIFSWTTDWGETQQFAFAHFEAKAEMMRTRAFEASEGVVDWLEILKRYQVPCCVCATTSFDQAAVTYLLSSSGLQPYFDVCVTAEDGCETTEQGYLVAAIKLRRPPMRCVVFEDEPRGVAAAHEATAKVVALMGSHSGGDLRHADMRVSALDDLSLMSLRELFKGLPPM